jgi:hypothetical protein
MRKRLLCSSICVILAAAAGSLGYSHVRAPQPASSRVAAPARASRRVASTADDRAPSIAADVDHAAPLARGSSGERFPATPVGRALDHHLLILVDVSPGADDRKLRSLLELRRNAKEASQDLLDAYHAADPADGFGRWLLSLTLSELKSNDGYPGLKEIANAEIPGDLPDNDHDGDARANESAIHQSAVSGLAALALAGNAAAEQDLLSLALAPPSSDDAVRTLAIKGYLAAGADYDARVQALEAQLPSRYHDVITLAVSQPEEATPPDRRPARPNHGG